MDTNPIEQSIPVNQHTNHRPRFYFVGIGILLLIVLAIVFISSKQKGSTASKSVLTPTQINQATSTDKNTLQPYISKELGFSFQYPNDMYIIREEWVKTKNIDDKIWEMQLSNKSKEETEKNGSDHSIFMQFTENPYNHQNQPYSEKDLKGEFPDDGTGEIRTVTFSTYPAVQKESSSYDKRGKQNTIYYYIYDNKNKRKVYIYGTTNNKKINISRLDSILTTLNLHSSLSDTQKNANADPNKLIYYTTKDSYNMNNRSYVVFDIASRSTKILFEGWEKLDYFSHDLTRNDYLDLYYGIASWDAKTGNSTIREDKRIDFTTEKTQNLSEEYLPTYNWDSQNAPGTPSIQSDGTNLTIYFHGSQEETTIVWPWADTPLTGWGIAQQGVSKDGKRAFFRLISTHVSDPQVTLYIVDTEKSQVSKFPRDKKIQGIKETYVDGKNNIVYYIALNGIFMQKMDSTQAAIIQIKQLDATSITGIMFPNNYENNSVGLRTKTNMLIKNIDTNEEQLVFPPTNTNTLTDIKWYKNYLLIFADSPQETKIISVPAPSSGYGIARDRQTGRITTVSPILEREQRESSIIGYVHNLKSKQTTEFIRRNVVSDAPHGEIVFVGWL